MTAHPDLLAAYDDQLRGERELTAAAEVEQHGPLWWGLLPGGRGFVTYRSLDGHADDLPALVAAVVDRFRAVPGLVSVEWKTRGHDHAPGLHDLLVGAGFEPEEVESVMVGRAADLAVPVPVPDGVVVRRLTEPEDLRRVSLLAEQVFGRPAGSADALADQVRRRPGFEVWAAEADGELVSSGRVDAVEGTDFAGLWGGCTLAEWRGRGIYRAVTAERARSAQRLGKSLMNSDSTEYSRPILERSGFVKVTTTTPYEWRP